jgi:AraC-like DNA-binding protein
MVYEQIQPPDYLSGYVRYFWTLDSSINTPLKTLRTIADGCPGLIFQQAEKGTFYQNEKQLPAIFLFGQSTKHAEIALRGQFSTVGIYFYPNALKSIFGLNAEELTNSCLDLNLLAAKQGSHLLEQLSNTPSITGQIELLSSYLFHQYKENNVQVEKPIHYALTQLIESRGNVSLKELQESLRLSERSLERKFKEHVGISPKLFSRICRFQASLDQLRTNNYSKFSDVAFENEYADQSHFIRAFKEFAGFSPYQYQRQSNEIVENLSELIL